MLFVVKIKNRKIRKKSYILEKTLLLSIICSKCSIKDEKIKEEELNKIMQIVDLIDNKEPRQKYGR